MRNYWFVINPVAGGGIGIKKFRAAEEALKERGITYQALYSAHKGDVPVLIRRALEQKADCIVIVGGDGTVREAVEPMAYQEAAFFIFPFGTGNDLAKTLGIASEPRAAVQQLLNGRVCPIDAVRANDSHYLNVAGFGFDVEVLQQTEHYKKRFGGKTSYMLGLLQGLLFLKRRAITLEHNGTEEQFNAIVLVAGNGKFFGGGMPALPQARMDDGLVDICIIHNIKTWRIPYVLLRFLKGRHLELRETRYLKVKKITVKTKTPLPVELDGEIIEQTPVTFEVLPGALRLLCCGQERSAHEKNLAEN